MTTFAQFKNPSGWIEVIVGGMYSGKTEELIRQIRRADIAKQAHQLFKPKIDNRYSATEVTSHNQTRQNSIIVDSASQILDHINEDTIVVGIDEAQFFDRQIINVANKLANAGVRVIIAGLDLDFNGQPFGCMPELMAIAEVVQKQHAICVVCGAPASRSQRLTNDKQEVVVAAAGVYEARCRNHFDPHLKAKKALSITQDQASSVCAEFKNNTVSSPATL